MERTPLEPGRWGAAAGDGAVRQRFVFASSRPWHRESFEALVAEGAHDWIWAGTKEELEAAVAGGDPRYIFFLHWNWIVPERIWAAHECVCFHMTDVPYGRGGSPLQNLIARGHRETKLTALRMVAEMDAGPVYAKRALDLDGRAEDIYRRAGVLSMEILRWMIKAQPEPVAQTGEPTEFARRTPSQSVLPADAPLDRLYDHIRMLDAPGYPLAFLDHGALRIEFSHAEIDGDSITARVVVRSRADHK